MPNLSPSNDREVLATLRRQAKALSEELRTCDDEHRPKLKAKFANITQLIDDICQAGSEHVSTALYDQVPRRSTQFRTGSHNWFPEQRRRASLNQIIGHLDYVEEKARELLRLPNSNTSAESDYLQTLLEHVHTSNQVARTLKRSDDRKHLADAKH